MLCEAIGQSVSQVAEILRLRKPGLREPHDERTEIMKELTKLIEEKKTAIENADYSYYVQIVESAARFAAQNSTILVVAKWTDAQPLLNSLHSFKSFAIQRSRVLLDDVTARQMREIDSALYELDSALSAVQRLRDIYQH